MRAHCFAICLAALLGTTPAFAHEVLTDTCATDGAKTCALEFDLPDFQLLRADPVVIGQTSLKILGADANGQIMSLDLSLADGSVAGSVQFDARLEQPEYAPGMIAPDGETFAVFSTEGSEDYGLQFFDATGQRL
ncbi:MAG: hypothetical protein ACRC6I_21365, partial [Paracoccaceae bacterium]